MGFSKILRQSFNRLSDDFNAAYEGPLQGIVAEKGILCETLGVRDYVIGFIEYMPQELSV